MVVDVSPAEAAAAASAADRAAAKVAVSDPARIVPVRPVSILNPRSKRTFVLVLKRVKGDGLQVETSLTAANLLPCNMCVEPLGTISEARGSLHYLAKYLSKNPVELTNTLSLIHAAQQNAMKYPSRAEDTGEHIRRSKLLLTKVLNRMSAGIEVSDTQVAMMLLGNPSYVSTHRFWLCFIWPALKYQQSKVLVP